MLDINSTENDEDTALTLASEDCTEDQFLKIHRFKNHEDIIIRKLIAHGPVLIRGGRGSGKSALLIEATNRVRNKYSHIAFAIYISLRYLPLLRSQGQQYENNFCSWLGKAISGELRKQNISNVFDDTNNVGNLQIKLKELARQLGKRIILLFDDAAHIGREAPLTEFFDIFRVLSTDLISCKASIYPGVTKFGTRFDVYNDATVIDIVRDERSSDFEAFFIDVISARYPSLGSDQKFSGTITASFFAKFLGRSVLGNIRALVIACAWFNEKNNIGYKEITSGLIYMSSNYYWPLLEEVAPKLGAYEPMVETAKEICELLFKILGDRTGGSLIVHKNICAKFLKPFEILEYVGFIARRDVSRAMKSGGRGVVFMANLCNILEKVHGARITSELAKNWLDSSKEMIEIHATSELLNDLKLPDISNNNKLSIFDQEIAILIKSNAYPYGLTQAKVTLLKDNEFLTVGDVADASDNALLNIDGIGERTVEKIRNVVYQAIWM
ncbi:MAG: hypothetical protein HQM03_02075 [Magnetococcales bacterium]|nr:hypothetical protein [Magnetococcales bacterium]